MDDYGLASLYQSDWGVAAIYGELCPLRVSTNASAVCCMREYAQLDLDSGISNDGHHTCNPMQGANQLSEVVVRLSWAGLSKRSESEEQVKSAVVEEHLPLTLVMPQQCMSMQSSVVTWRQWPQKRSAPNSKTARKRKKWLQAKTD